MALYIINMRMRECQMEDNESSRKKLTNEKKVHQNNEEKETKEKPIIKESLR